MKIGIASPVDIRQLADLVGREPESLPLGLGGAPIATLIRAMAAAGHRLSVYTFDFQAVDIRAFHGPALSLYVAPYRPRHRMRDLMRAEREAVAAMVRTDRPDVVNAHWGYEYALGALAAGVPVVTTLHDWAPAILRTQPTAYRAGRLAMYVGMLAKRANHRLTAVSPYIAGRIRRWTGRTCRVTPLGIPDEQIVAAPRRFPDRPPRLLAISQGFVPRKNVESLLRALPAIRAAVPGTTLELLGYGFEAGGPAQRWAVERGLTDGVSFVGQVQHAEVRARLDGSDLLVHPSIEETFGMALVEAMARGVPVIAGRGVGGPVWVLDDGKAGILADVRRPAAISDAVIDLLRTPASWEKLSEAVLRRVRDCYALSATMPGFIAAMRD
ncbi:MAG: glycosyltransferase family 4 protein, partial [Alphaproteobacteria bacterium]